MSGDIGRRIVIYGVTGSGKSTLARRLAEALGLGVIELDAIRHATGWDSTPWDEMRDIVQQKVDGYVQGWVCEGNYSVVADIPLSRADTVVWMHLPWRVSFWRLFWRTMRHGITGHRFYGETGPKESLVTAFASKHSILWWSATHHQQTNRHAHERITTWPHHANVYELRSSREIAAFLDAVIGTEAASRTAGQVSG